MVQSGGDDARAFLRGGGNIADIIASFDWAGTPMGPLDLWPTSIKTAVGLLLRSPVPIVALWGEAGTMIYNDAYSGFAGGRHPKLLGSPVREGWPEVADFNDNVMKVGLAGGTLSYTNQELTLFRTGRPEQVWMDLDYSPVIGESGKPVGVIAIVVETTARVQSEQKLRQSEERFRALTLASSGIVYRMSPDWQEMRELVGQGLLEDATQGTTRWMDVYLLPEDRKDILEAISVAVRDKKVFDKEHRVRRADGTVGWVVSRAIPILDNGGEITEWFGSASDITARREAESRLRFINALIEEVGKSSEADAALALTTRMLGEHLGVSICAYADMEPDQDHFTIRGDWTAPGSRGIVGYYSLADFGALAVSNLKAGQPLIIGDNSKELPAHEAAAFQQLGIAATICVSLVKDGRLTALMAVHDSKPRNWTHYELELLQEVTDRSWLHVERVRADKAAQTNIERLRLATTAASIGTWDFDPVTGSLQWDERCKHLFGLPADADIAYETFLAGVHPDDRERADRAVQNALESPDPFELEYRVIGLNDGVERWLVAHGETLFEKGRAARFVGTVLDITRRKKIEADLAVLNAVGASVAKELDLEKIVQTVTDAGVALAGAQFGAFFYNVLDEKGARYTLYSLSGAPRSAFENFPMPRSTAIFEPTFKGTAVVRSDDILKDPRYGKNAPRKGMPEGHLPVRSYLAVPVISRGGEVLGGLFFGHEETGRFTAGHETALVGIAGHAATAIDNAQLFRAAQREIAERTRAEGALQTLNATLEQRVTEEIAERSKAEEQLRQALKMEAVGQLTGGIAHDFNNMLAVVIGGLNLLQRKLARGETDVERFIEGATDAARRASVLTQRLLAFSRQQPLRPTPLDANRLVSGMSDLLSRTLGETIVVETVLAAGLWEIHADAPQLESALVNLAVNARDAMPAGGRLTIETANAYIDERYAKDHGLAAGQYALVAVTDTGIGMTPDVIARAFDPFYTTKSVGKGTGLGLSQVYGYVRQSGGNVKIYSEPRVGTTVKVYLPRHYGGGPAAVEPNPVRTLSGGLKSEVVLVVEDDARVRSVSVEALRDLGYTVIEAAGPREALTLLHAGQKITLLFTDVIMPEMSGRQLAEQARALDPNIKVLFTTGYTRNAIVHNGVLDPGTQLLSKPFNVDELAVKVRSVLDG